MGFCPFTAVITKTFALMQCCFTLMINIKFNEKASIVMLAEAVLLIVEGIRPAK